MRSESQSTPRSASRHSGSEELAWNSSSRYLRHVAICCFTPPVSAGGPRPSRTRASIITKNYPVLNVTLGLLTVYNACVARGGATRAGRISPDHGLPPIGGEDGPDQL